MDVKLINATSELAAHLATAVCVGKGDSIYNNGDIKQYSKGLDIAIESGHLSVLEHIYFTWYITGISRALSHQLIRHRIASYSQESQRYVEIDTSHDWFVIPDSIENCDNAVVKKYFIDTMNKIEFTYRLLCCTGGIPKEDARFVLPNACKTNIVVSMNGRSFIEAASKRLCLKAQWEIRDLFTRMRETIKEDFHSIYKLADRNCEIGRCKEKNPCKQGTH